MTLLKSNFPTKEVPAEPEKKTLEEEFKKKALENLGGSMVFVERKKLVWDSKN